MATQQSACKEFFFTMSAKVPLICDFPAIKVLFEGFGAFEAFAIYVDVGGHWNLAFMSNDVTLMLGYF